jgi:hypothetical protein
MQEQDHTNQPTHPPNPQQQGKAQRTRQQTKKQGDRVQEN